MPQAPQHEGAAGCIPAVPTAFLYSAVLCPLHEMHLARESLSFFQHLCCGGSLHDGQAGRHQLSGACDILPLHVMPEWQCGKCNALCQQEQPPSCPVCGQWHGRQSQTQWRPSTQVVSRDCWKGV